MTHPLGAVIIAAARGQWPPTDGGFERVEPWRAGVFGIVAFTAHAVVCLPQEFDDDTLRELGADGFGGAHDPRFITEVLPPAYNIDILDLLLVADGAPGLTDLVQRPDLADHPRAVRATWMRDDVRVFGLPDTDDAVITVARGLGGLPEVSIELSPLADGRGLGRRLAREARALIGGDEVLLASVSPGNARSLRAFLAAGFRPVGSVQLFYPLP